MSGKTEGTTSYQKRTLKGQRLKTDLRKSTGVSANPTPGKNLFLNNILGVIIVTMSTGSQSDADDALETSLTRLDSHSDDDFNDDEGLNTKPKQTNMQKRLKSPKDGRQSQRHAANARERARMRVLAKAFSRLKTSLPWVPADTKLSKLDTLRLASSYINHLRQLLHEDKYEKTLVHPSWPFMVSGRPDDTKDISTFRLCGATA
ncbi:transcription factor 21 isoform X2 [Tachysurus fulvidraco]|uniref:transcription factor 21 isoform X2 n=1 Tax=Tachysurus fulvidraco TaxID=1234273 RepID=UPI001FEF0EBE|nr:transcription factor 21 isoform X2 [Tachysurus fulvidraco]